MEIVNEAHSSTPKTIRLRLKNEFAASGLRLFLVGAHTYAVHRVVSRNQRPRLWEFPCLATDGKIPLLQFRHVLELTQASPRVHHAQKPIHSQHVLLALSPNNSMHELAVGLTLLSETDLQVQTSDTNTTHTHTYSALAGARETTTNNIGDKKS